jgi:hypothetical protein
MSLYRRAAIRYRHKKRQPKPDKPFKLPDEKGMYLLVHPNGSKYFRLDYRFEGKRKTLALGVYPDTTLKQSRERLYAAKQQIADGIDPSENKKAIKTTLKLSPWSGWRKRHRTKAHGLSDC